MTCVGISGKKGLWAAAPARTLDIRDSTSVREVLARESFDYVFNAGGYIEHTPYAEGGRRVIDHHLVGLLNLLDTLDRRSVKGFIQLGSSDEYGEAPAPQREDSDGRPISPYAFAKQSATKLIRMLADQEGFPGVVVRLFLVYGPGQGRSRFLPQVITACLRGEPFSCTLGEQHRDFCYVEDVVDGIVRAALLPQAKGQIINVASGKPVTIRRMTEIIVKLIGAGKPEYGSRPYRPGESMMLYADISKATSLLNWAPAISLEDGLRRTIDYYKERLT